MILFRPPKPKPAPRKPKDSDVASSYAEEVTAGQMRPPWQMLKTDDALPPRALTVTSVTQSHDLQVMKDLLMVNHSTLMFKISNLLTDYHTFLLISVLRIWCIHLKTSDLLVILFSLFILIIPA